jgi:cytochrome c-type protein NapB
MRHLILAVGIAVLGLPIFAQEYVATLRKSVPLDQNAEAAPIPEVINSDIRQVRNYPDQPPVIPHQIDNYQINLDANKCLTCHSRTAVAISQAPMVSVTHFMNREGQTLAAVTPRRYFCTQCHVVQHDAPLLVENGFVDVDQVLDYVRQQERGGR